MFHWVTWVPIRDRFRKKGREEDYVHFLERSFLEDEDTEEGAFLVLEAPDFQEDFLVCSCLDWRLGEEELGEERKRSWRAHHWSRPPTECMNLWYLFKTCYENIM